MRNKPQLADMIGLVFDNVKVSKNNDRLSLTSTDHDVQFYHRQDCCESVYIAQIDGELLDLVGSPITMADIAESGDGGPAHEYSESYTWTFLKLATVKGYVTVRWYGESNGYYSESISWSLDGIDEWGWEVR